MYIWDSEIEKIRTSWLITSNVDEIIKKLRGPKGTQVIVTIKRLGIDSFDTRGNNAWRTENCKSRIDYLTGFAPFIDKSDIRVYFQMRFHK